MGVQPFEQILDTETLTTDMTNTAFVILIHGFHNKTYQTGGFVIQLGQIDFHGIVGTVHRFSVMDEITHLHIQQQRLVGILHVECIEVPVFGYYRHIGLLPEIACRGLYSDYILGTVGLAGYQVCRTEIHILDRSRENDMDGLVIRYFQSVRRNHLAETDLAGQPLIIITATLLRPGSRYAQ